MLKLLRKYNKHLLAVFMALLLVIWLTDQSLRQIFSPDESKTVVAHAFGQEVRHRDLEWARRRADILQFLNIPWRALPMYTMATAGVPWWEAQNGREPLDEMEWYMLTQEARRANILVLEEDVRSLLNQIPQGYQRVEGLRDRGYSLEEINEAVADFLRVRQAAARAAGVVQVTEPQIRSQLAEYGRKVRVKYVVLPASSFVEKDAPVDPAEAAAHFEKYKSYAPGHGPDLGYGYRQDPAVQFEYVKAGVDKIAPMIAIDEQEAYGYWKSHKDEFKHTPTTVPSSGPATATATAPATQPVPYEKFDQARADVLARLQREQARKEAAKLIRDVIEAVSQMPAVSTASSPSTQPGDDVLSRVVDAFRGRRFGTALEYRRSPWRTQRELFSESIGRASYADARSSVPFSQAVFQVEGLAKRPAPEDRGSEYYLKLGQPSPSPLTDPQGNAYMYRVVAVREAAPPASLDEVRQAVERDIREQKAYEAAGQTARTLAAVAADAGIDQAFQALGELAAKLGPLYGRVQSPEPFARRQLSPGMRGSFDAAPSVPLIGSDATFVREAFRLGEARTATQPHRVAVVELKRARKWVVVQWVENIPLRQDTYEELRPQVVQQLYTQAMADFLRAYFEPQQIRSRTQWKDALESQAQAPQEAS